MEIPLEVNKLLIILPAAIFGLLASVSTGENVLYTDKSLNSGESFNNGNYRLTMQSDCNLVLYDSDNKVWESFTYGKGSGCYTTMQGDGNLVIYSTSGPVWSSGTAKGEGYYVCVLQRDRNVVVYGPSLWSSGTNTFRACVGTNTFGATVVIDSKLAGGMNKTQASGGATSHAGIRGRKIAMPTKM
ncbi:PREDICTED: mannose-specific lectin-like [Nelumbo nucifera]|uniref:Mannose-specific lectin-like n=2 Tax=Nelumbo nucifera TaxID=4432 RepID=A0A1U8A8F5_NELNU|nr:PREDICTED: mannose-specific lectin-like [Nelumbo nucifera]DAD28333.1 TPA_asm: hypothetical protein HUJ06_029801 [Nelumbo nucifera]